MTKALIDRISGDVARLLVGDEGVAVAIPISQLPRGVREGMMLRVKFTIDPTAPMAGMTTGATAGDE